MKFIVLMICMTLPIFKAFAHKFSWCMTQWYFHKHELSVVIASYSIIFVSPSFLPTITRAPSVAIQDMLTKAKENCFDGVFVVVVVFTTSYKSRYLVVSLNGTKEAISLVLLYLLSVRLMIMATRAILVWHQHLLGIIETSKGIQSNHPPITNISHQTMSPSTIFKCFFNTFRDSDSTTCLCSPFQCLATLLEKIYLTSNLFHSLTHSLHCWIPKVLLVPTLLLLPVALGHQQPESWSI